MKVAALLTPTPDIGAILRAARAADHAEIDAVGFWDHYHSGQPDWAYASGWSLMGAVARATERVRLLPMVLNNLHYEVGVLAKESSMLSLVSGGRFELGIGAGDWPSSFAAWGRPFPPVDERLTRLVETIEALRAVWSGRPTTFEGRHVRLDGAICTPAPDAPPRVVVGVGGSRRTLGATVRLADELNLYPDEALVADAKSAVAAVARPVALSVFLSWEWDKWPADIRGELGKWRDLGLDRACVSLGSGDMVARIEQLAGAATGA